MNSSYCFSDLTHYRFNWPIDPEKRKIERGKAVARCREIRKNGPVSIPHKNNASTITWISKVRGIRRIPLESHTASQWCKLFSGFWQGEFVKENGIQGNKSSVTKFYCAKMTKYRSESFNDFFFEKQWKTFFFDWRLPKKCQRAFQN